MGADNSCIPKHPGRVKPAEPVGVVDAAGDLESDLFRNLWRQRRLLPPLRSSSRSAVWRLRWSLALLVAAACEACVIPLFISFTAVTSVPASYVAIGYVIDACYWVDVLLQFRTTSSRCRSSRRSRGGRLVAALRRVRQREASEELPNFQNHVARAPN